MGTKKSGSSFSILSLPLLIFVRLQFLELVFKVNTNKATRKRSALQRGVPLSKRSKGFEVAKEDLTIPPKEFIHTEDNVDIAAFRPKDVHTWLDLMNAPVEDLHLLSPKNPVLEKGGSSNTSQGQDSPIKDLGPL